MKRLLPALCCLLLAGCGLGKSERHIQLILDWKAQMEHAGFFVALEEGYYAAEGLKVEILEGNGAPTTARVVGNGVYPIGIASGSATVMAGARKIPIVSVAVINQHSPVAVYSLAESGIIQPGDLVGKRIGVNVGGTKHREFQAFLRKVGIQEDQIELVGMTEASPAPLLAGQVDAMLGYTEDQPVTVELRGQKVSRILLADHGIDLYSTNVVVNADYLKRNPGKVRRFLRASLKGWRKAIADPDLAVSAYMAHRPESDEAFNRANFRNLIPILQSDDTRKTGVGTQTAARWTHTRDILHDLGMIDRKIDVAEIYTNDYLPSP
jgi:NitT/TauT family transport system substrate-binding protein